MSKTLTLETINERFKDSFEQNVIALKYINRRSLISLKCLDCNFEWE